ncbi:dicarboxylate/amino acid:cation symporter [Apibacter sp. ESL0404]|uniref:dicarboxylate/amino acid:cation symporter n=1 Tax=Apibacter sp. ESL0404 TaxID=2704651 RepID=UPI001C6A1AAC|nr:cation:dicarboxylase symporter family transporter [Apibacter sp. ESL0404]QYN51410.1 cation:dicarboxylase symporter family transporter [Apibacter sp. ESL0404]
MNISRFFNILPFIFITITGALYLVNFFFGVIPENLFFACRWLFIISIIIFAFKKKNLTIWIFVALLVGACLGYDFPGVSGKLDILSKVFLKLIKTIIAPLIFATLVHGIASHSDIKQVGRMGWKSLVYFEIVTTFALFIGLAAINLTQAGVGTKKINIAHEQLPQVASQSWEDIILHIFPENIAKSVAEGQVLQIVIFSILFGVALIMVTKEKRMYLVNFTDSLADTMFKFTNIIMYFAPFGVLGAMAYTIAHMGLDALIPLIKLLLTLYGALIVFVLIVFLPIALLIKMPIKRFIKEIKDVAFLAFSTASSEAALPKAMIAMERLGVPRKVIAFVMPTGYSFNLDGTTLYLSLAIIFVAQATGVHVSFTTQLIMILTLIVTSKGVAGVPRASLVILMGTASTFNLQEWPILMILGIDTLMDMARATVNVIGNCLATAVIARWEGEFDPEEAEKKLLEEENVQKG